jgi:hypothetical protein
MFDRIASVLLSTLVVACAPVHHGAQRAPDAPARYPGTPIAGGHVDAVVAPVPDERPGLGTVWGESVYAPVRTQPFERASIDPWAVALLHYNDAAGVTAHAAHVGAGLSPLEVYAGDGSIGVSVVDASGAMLPGFTGAGRTWVVGADGERYRLVVRNGTGARFEIVASVDGLDVIDGKPADPNRRGYILDAHGVLVIDGFRQSDDAVAAFRFGAVSESYAARTSGDRNVGVVGFAIFAEQGAVWTPGELHRRDTADPFPARGYASPP